jgi:hypothetical protein
MLLPYLDQQKIFDCWNDPNQALVVRDAPLTRNRWMTPYIDQFICPSSGKEGDPRNSPISFVSNNGFLVRGSDPSLFHTSPYPERADRSHNGVFVDCSRGSQKSMTWAAFSDGTKHTVVLTENLDAAPYFSLGKLCGVSWLYALDADVQPDVHVPTPVSLRPSWARINSMLPRDPSPIQKTRPSSNHVDGVNMLFANGSVKFIEPDLEYHVFQAMLTPDDARSDAPKPSNRLFHTDHLAR